MWRYEHIDEIRQRLITKGIIDLAGEVDEDMVMYVREAFMILAANDNPDIRVIINSNGGHVRVGLYIYDILKNYPGKITGEVSSFCRSMATVILQACDHRVASPNSNIKIHNVLINNLSLDILRNSKYLAESIAEAEADQKTINKIYQKKTGQLAKIINRESRMDYDMTAKEALEFGLIDEII